MATREEIREGMWEFILEVRQYLCNTEFAPEPFSKPVDVDVLREMGNTQLKKMDSQGVVIKVEGELPPNPYRDKNFLNSAVVFDEGKYSLLNAGFKAVVPFIEEADG